MPHEVEIVEVKEVSDDLVSYRLRCCDDDTSDSWITLSVAIPDHGPSLTARKAEIAARHDQKEAWRAKNQP